MRGSRVQAVVNELQGEKIDIIPWSPDAATFIVNALQPAEVSKVVLDEDAERIEVVVPDEQLSLAIGRSGQNVRLASQLTGWDIDILTEQEESERRQKEFAERTQLFMEALDVDEMVGQLLASEGFTWSRRSPMSIPTRSPRSRASTRTLPSRSRRARGLSGQASRPSTTRSARSSASKTSCKEVPGLTMAMLVALGKNGIKTVEDFAGARPTTWSARRSARTARRPVMRGRLTASSVSRPESRRDDHGGSAQSRLDHRGGPFGRQSERRGG